MRDLEGDLGANLERITRYLLPALRPVPAAAPTSAHPSRAALGSGREEKRLGRLLPATLRPFCPEGESPRPPCSQILTETQDTLCTLLKISM